MADYARDGDGFAAFHKDLAEYRRVHHHLRQGQSLMNFLWRCRPDLYERIMNHHAFESFYNDEHEPSAWQMIVDHWESPDPEELPFKK